MIFSLEMYTETGSLKPAPPGKTSPTAYILTAMITEEYHRKTRMQYARPVGNQAAKSVCIPSRGKLPRVLILGKAGTLWAVGG